MQHPVFSVKARHLVPRHDKLYLTNLDQLFNYYYPIALFYNAPNPIQSRSHNVDPAEVLRGALEEMVAHHYPWAAGRLRLNEEEQRLVVDTNEDGGPGVQFVAATVDRALEELGDLSEPSPAFEPLFARIDENGSIDSRPLLALQVTKFCFGRGFCISMTFHHAVFDGTGASLFLRNLASLARGEGLCVPFDEAPRELRIRPHDPPSPPTLLPHPCFGHKQQIQSSATQQQPAAAASTKFEFSKEALAQLRAQALSWQHDCTIHFTACSRFHALSAHLWRAKARSIPPHSSDPLAEFPLRIAVNLRQRIVPTIPHNYVGNAFSLTTTTASVRDLKEKSLAFAVEKIQAAIGRVTCERFQSEVDQLQILGGAACVLPAPLAVVSLAGLGFYETDCGWGKPAYCGRLFRQPRNRMIILDGNAQRTSLNVLAVFDSQDELQRFQDAIILRPT